MGYISQANKQIFEFSPLNDIQLEEDPRATRMDKGFFLYNSSTARSDNFVNARENVGRHKLKPGHYLNQMKREISCFGYSLRSLQRHGEYNYYYTSLSPVHLLDTRFRYQEVLSLSPGSALMCKSST